MVREAIACRLGRLSSVDPLDSCAGAFMAVEVALPSFGKTLSGADT